MTQDSVHFYFAYGSNMNPARVEQRRMQFESAVSGILHDFELAFNKRSVKYPGAASANVMNRPGARTEGVVYRLTEPAQIQMMDPYEGYPVRYQRQALPIEIDSGSVHAWVYIANADHVVEGLNPARWYLEHLLAGESFLSREYHAVLAQVPCLPDSSQEPGS